MERYKVRVFICCALSLLCLFAGFLFLEHAEQHTENDKTEVMVVEKEVPVVEQVFIEVPVETNIQTPYYSQVVESMTDEEKNMLAQIVYLESGNQSLIGQRCVVEVIFNRVLSPLFPNSVSEVILQDNPVQFTTSSRLGTVAPKEQQYLAIELTAQEIDPLLDQDVMYFATYDIGKEVYDKIGGHYFFYQ